MPILIVTQLRWTETTGSARETYSRNGKANDRALLFWILVTGIGYSLGLGIFVGKAWAAMSALTPREEQLLSKAKEECSAAEMIDYEGIHLTVSFDSEKSTHTATLKMPHKTWEEMLRAIKLGEWAEKQGIPAVQFYAAENKTLWSEWKDYVCDKFSGLCSHFDWDGNVQDEPFEIACKALARLPK